MSTTLYISTRQYICEQCGLTFDNAKIKANHVRWKHNDVKKYQESNRVSKNLLDFEKLGKLQDFNVVCHKCNNIFVVNKILLIYKYNL